MKPKYALLVASVTCVLWVSLPCAQAQSSCGNGIIEETELCDDGNLNGTAQSCCRPNCKFKIPGTDCGGDDNGCTADICGLLGVCLHVEVGAGICDDRNACTDDSCDRDLGCVNADNDAACDDANPCTGDDVCRDGVCTGKPVVCPTDRNECTDEVCDPKTGECGSTPNTDPCDDGQFCNGMDTCSAGTCGHAGDPCPGADGDGNCRESCNEAANACTAADGDQSPCDDGDACTVTDTCSRGTCGGAPRDCDAELVVHNPCQMANCDPVKGCVVVNVQEGIACPSDGNPCTDDVCDGAGVCGVANDTRSCDDGLFCTGTEECSGGICRRSGDPCARGPECADTCVEEGDSCNSPAGDACGDPSASVCNGADTCDGRGHCRKNLAPETTVCRDLTGACDTIEFCDGAGACPRNDIKAAGELCEGAADGIFCTEDRCDGAGASASHCKSTKQDSLCDDGDECTEDRCAPGQGGARGTGCAHESREGQRCDDHNSCTRGDVCFRDDETGDLVCGGSPRRAGRSCNDGTCVGGNGECNAEGECLGNAQPRPEGTPCNDGNSCTVSDACTAEGECAGHPLDKGAVCTDGEFCTAPDLCIPTLDGVVCRSTDTPMNGQTCRGGWCFTGECVPQP